VVFRHGDAQFQQQLSNDLSETTVSDAELADRVDLGAFVYFSLNLYR
jgi:hypothetical protein